MDEGTPIEVRSRRPQGTGSIYQRQNGTWAAIADFGYAGTGRCRKHVYGKTREEVERKLDILLERGPEAIPRRPRSTVSRPEADRQAAEIATHTLEQWIAKRNAIGCCIYCGVPGPLTKDHATPVTRGGSNALDNVVPACMSCNVSKGNLTAAEYLARRLL